MLLQNTQKKKKEDVLSSQEIFEYAHLDTFFHEIISAFKEKGFIMVRGVPGFVEAYKTFIRTARQFIALPDSEKVRCTPENYENRGWSYGVEYLYKDVPDAFKGSYYAQIFDLQTEDPNIWPELLPQFKQAYLTLGRVISEAGKKILALMELEGTIESLGRWLYYGSVNMDQDSSNPHWCALHRDHGALTALCPEIYYKNNQHVEKPKGTGLHIRGEEVSAPEDVVMFQIGEWLELYTDGTVTATDHHIEKAYGGFERYAFALFLNLDQKQKAHCHNPKVLEKYADRYRSGISFYEWHVASLAKYNPK